jgi:hypothetical protein
VQSDLETAGYAQLQAGDRSPRPSPVTCSCLDEPDLLEKGTVEAGKHLTN